jgi:hypothetical protein
MGFWGKDICCFMLCVRVVLGWDFFTYIFLILEPNCPLTILVLCYLYIFFRLGHFDIGEIHCKGEKIKIRRRPKRKERLENKRGSSEKEKE